MYPILREDNLLCCGSESCGHDLPAIWLATYPSLARRRLNGDQISFGWPAHRCSSGTGVCLAWRWFGPFSRRVTGSPGTGSDAGRHALAASALGMALKQRQPEPGLIPITPTEASNTLSTDYTGLLGQHGIRISMSRTGNPYDNAKAESFIKTLSRRGSLPAGVS